MIKPTHKAIKEFQDAQSRLRGHGVNREMGMRSAFQYLLSGTARTAGWTLIPEETLPGLRVRPDGTFKDQWSIPRGWWESKDEHDDLEKEIQSKIGKGYPTLNTIFEDSRRAILFQNKRHAGEFDLANATQLANLLTAFYSFTPPNIIGFEQAVTEFQAHIPDLAKGLLVRIEKGYHDNKKFRTAFDGFYTLCQQSLNPNIRVEAVKEMLVQHLLTERLIRTIFNNPQFTRRNVIAAEVEKVIDALVGSYFNREEFLATLDRFYKAIEDAARTIESFSDKQHFLNSVYERFFQGYSVKVADTHGIVYTPQPIVDFMCASVEEVLKTEFGKSLGSKDVFIIDPCTGTGNFVVNLLNRVPAKDLERVYRTQFFANEVMLMPYYIAALNIEHAYYERTGNYEPFEGLCFVDTLDLAEAKQSQLGFMSEKNLARVERQRKTPITVVIGNPPYNMGQVNENDNNKNRKYEVIDRRVAETYVKDSSATLRNKLSDAYVRFYRWATDRLEDRPGIVCFVSNNGFLRGIAFDGFRRLVAQDFDFIYHFDFRGNARTSGERRRQEGGNIFHDLIRVGVGITVLVRTKARKKKGICYHTVGDYLKWEDKDGYLRSFKSVADVPWQTLTPDKRNNWLVAGNADEYESFVSIGSKEAKATKGVSSGTIFKMHSLGIATNRDAHSYDYDREKLAERAETFVEIYNSTLDKFKRKRSEAVQDLIDTTDKRIKWTRQVKKSLEDQTASNYDTKFLRKSLYRPFDSRYVYFDDFWVEERYQQHTFFPIPKTEKENIEICVPSIGPSRPFQCLVTNVIPDLHFTGDTQCFPFYIYEEDGTGRRENVTEWAVKEFRERYEGGGMRDETKKSKRKKADSSLAPHPSSLEKWDIFYYVYGILHHPGYREKFGDNLKRELPRIPFAPDFWAFSEAGRKLSELHLKYEELPPIWEETPPNPPAKARGKGKPDSGHAGTHASAEPTPPYPPVNGGEIRLVIDAKAKTRDLYRVEKMRLVKIPGGSGDPPRRNPPAELKVNGSITVTGIPAEAFEYKLGNRSALEWVVDQYQIKTDKRSGITSDPNREDDPKYIVRLVGQVIRVSLETVAIVKSLPQEFC